MGFHINIYNFDFIIRPSNTCSFNVSQTSIICKPLNFLLNPYSTHIHLIYNIIWIHLFFFFFVFLGLHPRHMEFPRLGVELELEPPACTIATATPNMSGVCDLHHSSWQGQILNLLSEARNRIWVLVDTRQIFFRWATTGTPEITIFALKKFSSTLEFLSWHSGNESN